MLKKILSAILISSFFAIISTSNAVFADITLMDSMSGGADATGNCGTFWDSCYGTSWQKYKVTADKLPTEGVFMSYTTATGGPIYIKGCPKDSIIYNHGFEVIPSKNNNYATAGMQVSTQWNKSWGEAKHYSVYRGDNNISVTYAKGGKKGNIMNYTEAVGYVTNNEARKDFASMLYRLINWKGPGSEDALTTYGIDLNDLRRVLNADNVGSEEDLLKSNSFAQLWNQVGAFCYSSKEQFNPDPTDPDPTYYSQSKAIATSNGTSVRADTGIVSESSTANSDEVLRITTNDEVSIVFTHDLYSDKKISDEKNWSVTRTYKTKLGSDSSGNGGSGKTKLETKWSSYYWTNVHLFTYGSGSHTAGNQYTKVKFSSEGTYEYCQQINFEGIYTKACVTIAVEDVGDPIFYGESTAKATASSGSKSASTGVVRIDSNKTVNASDLNVTAGTKVTLEFTHNLYSSKKVSNDKVWIMSRDLTTSGPTLSGGTASTGYKSKVTSGKTKYEGYVDSKKLYIANNRRHSSSDGQSNGSYVMLDKYTATFNNAGRYKYCEWIETRPNDNSDYSWTGACVYVNVTPAGCDPNDCNCSGTCQSTTPCGQPLPTSYTNSSASSGTTSVISLVRNLSLTGTYRNYQKEVYAKPTDTVNWCHGYYPGVQYAANTTVTDYNTHPEPKEGLWYSNTLDNHIFSAYTSWTNKFDIKSTNVRPSYSDSESFFAGMTDTKEDTNNDNVEIGQAGQTLSETITSGYPSSVSASSGKEHTWKCHWYEKNANKCGTYNCNCRYEDDEDKCTTDKDGNETCEQKWVCDQCPDSCYGDKCYHTNEYYYNTMSGTATASSSVKVPYNFTNSATVEIRNELVYAGETATIDSASVTVAPKENSVTQGTYATQVDSAKAKLIGYLSSSDTGTEKLGYGNSSSDLCSALPVKNNSCNELGASNNMSFNSSASMDGSEGEQLSSFVGQTYNVYDAKAGDYYCVVAAVYPYSSGDDTNMSTSGSDNWYISVPSCRVIAKRPSFQVWGGSVYSEKSISTSVAAKNNIRDIYSYSSTSKSNTTIYGSWVEQSVLANGLVSGLASGAASGDLASKPYSGSKEGSSPNYCTNRVPLSIANYSTSTSESICPSYQQTGNAGLTGVAIDRDALMSYWWVMDTAYVNKSNINLASDYVDTRTIQGNQVRYTETGHTINRIYISSATIPKGVTHIVHASGNVKINGDITYQDTTYTSQAEIPKLIIYAEDSITIDCNVSRIDAILIADGRVNTCDSNSFDSSSNAHQLKINGMVIADSLVLNRTYGAGPGENSSIPAEIINYDTSAIVWGKGMSESNSFESFTTVYQHEIAPRY